MRRAWPGGVAQIAARWESARGLAHSKTLARMCVVPVCVKRLWSAAVLRRCSTGTREIPRRELGRKSQPVTLLISGVLMAHVYTLRGIFQRSTVNEMSYELVSVDFL